MASRPTAGSSRRDSKGKLPRRASFALESKDSSRRGSIAINLTEEIKKLPPKYTNHTRRNSAASAAGSAGGFQDGRRAKLAIWPEWSDTDVNAEKWDVAHKGKDKDKGKSPTVQHFFEDPEGKLEMPPALKVDHWKRPQDFISEKTPVVVDPDGMGSFDLVASNEHIHGSEFMRCVISQIAALWDMCAVKNPPLDSQDTMTPYEEYSYTWKPWEHIYALQKVSKGPHTPVYNPHGKYVVRLYWMGCWRKITIDDTIPFDDNNKMMLPATTMSHELWPMLLSKALIKVASLDYSGGSSSSEFGDCSVIHCLSGWLREAIPVQPSHISEVWELLKNTIPEWKLPESDWDKLLDGSVDQLKKDAPPITPVDMNKDEKDSTKDGKDGKKDGKDKAAKDAKEKDKGKDAKDAKDKGKDKDKDKNKEKVGPDETPIPDKPEIVVFASYWSTPKYPAKISVLGEVAEASEKLRQSGLSYTFPHPVWITQTRSCPLEPPPPPENIPTWKLIRPKKKKEIPSDEPKAEREPPKPIQCLEITSPFVNYKVSPVPIPVNTQRPKSALERGSTRATSVDIIDEEDECSESDFIREESMPVTNTSKPGTPSSLVEKKSSLSGKEKLLADKRLGSATTAPSLDLGIPGVEIDDEFGLSQSNDQLTADTTTKPKKFWMDYDIFAKCFKTIYIFHKPATYICNQKHIEMKSFAPSPFTAKSGDGKKPAPPIGGEDRIPFYLFVDNLDPIEIVVSFSAVCRWFEPPPSPILIEEKKSHSSMKGHKDGDKDGLVAVTSASVLDGLSGREMALPTLTAGSLVAEPYSWKSLVTGQPILRLRTTGTKAAVLNLPQGRHVLRFMMSAPLGYNIHLCSTVKFVFGDEETVMAELTKESCRFVDNSTQVITSLGKCINNFGDGELLKQSFDELVSAHCPYRKDKRMSKQHHFQVLL